MLSSMGAAYSGKYAWYMFKQLSQQDLGSTHLERWVAGFITSMSHEELDISQSHSK